MTELMDFQYGTYNDMNTPSIGLNHYYSTPNQIHSNGRSPDPGRSKTTGEKHTTKCMDGTHAWFKEWQTYSERSTFHGVRYIYDNSPSRIRK